MKIKSTLKLALVAIISMVLTTACNQQKADEKITFDVSLIDTSINPANDFYHYANNGWIKNNPLPDDESRYGSFDQLAKETSMKVQTIVEDLAKQKFEDGTIEQKISDFYSVGMDTTKINKLGISPLKDELETINSFSDINGLINQISHFHLYGISSMFGFGPSPDAKNSEMMIASLSQGGLGMNDRDYYVNDDAGTKKIREAYVNHLSKMFQLAGADETTSAKDAQTVLNIETRLAKASMTRLERRDPKATYNKMAYDEVKTRYNNFDWNLYLSGLGLENSGDIDVNQPAFFDELNTMITEVPINDWKIYFKWNLLNSTANYLSSDFENQDFDFYGKTMQGSKQIRERWRRVLGSTNGALGMAIGKKFTEKYFPAQAKERMVTLVGNLKTALGQRIENLEWMSEETKAKAEEKLAAVRVKIGYPNEWRDFSSLEISRESYVTNALNARKFNTEYYLSKIGKSVNKEEWFMTPQTVNAYYSPAMNEICFPAGILQPPFFYLDGDDAVNYGAIGAVIGHEMSHGFDDKGRLYDKFGNLKAWWTEEDSKKFNTRTQVLVDQFDAIIVLDSVHANGKLSLGENIADFGGLNISHTAFMNAQKENPQAELIDGYTPDQRFFLSWARVWAQNVRNKEILRRTKEDVHSLGINRVNVPISNMPEFHAAFGIKEGDVLYKAEKERASIW